MNDYKLSEIKQLCVHQSNCTKCPIENFCLYSLNGIPRDWSRFDNEETNDKYSIKDLKKIFWKHVAKYGIEITNQNIDYVVEQAVKEYNKKEV